MNKYLRRVRVPKYCANPHIIRKSTDNDNILKFDVIGVNTDRDTTIHKQKKILRNVWISRNLSGRPYISSANFEFKFLLQKPFNMMLIVELGRHRLPCNSDVVLSVFCVLCDWALTRITSLDKPYYHIYYLNYSKFKEMSCISSTVYNSSFGQ